jgi:mono/diheme cytochrome c family protein
MYYSRAYEAYGYNNVDDYQKLAQEGVFYNGLPVNGTMARGDVATYSLPANDSGYAMAVNYKSPLDSLNITPDQKKEAERLYLVNCAICHGANLDGNGPLWKGGDGPYPAAPRNLKDDYSKKLSDGQMYHVIMYGKGQMGSYASQVGPAQRWWIINYIREKQGPAKAATDTSAVAAAAKATTGASADTTTKK